MTETDVHVLVQALLDRHGMLRLRAVADGPDGWALTVPEPGAADALGCVRTAPVLTAEALAAARSRLDPANGVMVSALWVVGAGQLVLMIHHLAIDGVSWRILLEDLNTGWTQLRRGEPVALPAGGTSFARWSGLLAEHARQPDVLRLAQAWTTVSATPAALPPTRPDLDTYANAGRFSADLDAETTRLVLGEVPAAFHLGVHDILLIAFALAVGELSDDPTAPIGIDVEGHGRHEELAEVDLSRTVGWFTAKYPVALRIGGVRWSQVLTGDSALGAVVKDAKEQLRGLPDGLTYGLLRYLNPDVDLAGADPSIGFNYLGRWGGPPAEHSEDAWRLPADGLSVSGIGAAVPIPLAHAVELNAATVDTDTGPGCAPTGLGRRRYSTPRASTGSLGCGSRRWPGSARTCRAAEAD